MRHDTTKEARNNRRPGRVSDIKVFMGKVGFPELKETGFEVGTLPLSDVKGSKGSHPVKLNGSQLTYRADNGEALALVDKNFKVVQNRRLWGIVADAVCETMPGEFLGRSALEEQVSDKGTSTSFTLRFPEASPVIQQGPVRRIGSDGSYITYNETNIGFNVTVRNGFDSGAKVVIETKAVDLLCNNGMVMVHDDRFEVAADSGLDEEALSEHVMARTMGYQRDLGTWGRWARTPIDPTQATLPLAEARVGRSLGASIIRRYHVETRKRGSTLWALYSAMTNYSTHEPRNFWHNDDILRNRESQEFRPRAMVVYDGVPEVSRRDVLERSRFPADYWPEAAKIRWDVYWRDDQRNPITTETERAAIKRRDTTAELREQLVRRILETNSWKTLAKNAVEQDGNFQEYLFAKPSNKHRKILCKEPELSFDKPDKVRACMG